jgi:hypothetical protein
MTKRNGERRDGPSLPVLAADYFLTGVTTMAGLTTGGGLT